ncbi:MAG: glycine dehydrogenase (aminomethyl-transferring) [Omnitrophica WOR_2 bacterium RIFCSPLOWO2_02_FULL_50_19]|nr:MAG: glycine dehydrogenase (aminomethyl-transferring) [Omnitrophica WOR_2 bacterium RIFCSPLOWO2_02_FULL_50_19]
MKYSPHTDKDKKEMLGAIGAASSEELFKAIPKELRIQKLDLPEGISELELKKLILEKTGKNYSTQKLNSFLGGGAYEHYIPQVIESLISRGEFLTAYTPYQAEASQGTLQAIYEYQSLICELTGMDVANASMYDGASALAEAVILAVRETGRSRVIFSSSLHPEYKQVIKTYLEGYKIEFVEIPHAGGSFDEAALKREADDKTACVVVQNPNFFGCIEKVDKIESICHSCGALLIACVNPVSLGVLKSPGEYNADIAVGEGQPLGIPMSYGGPYLGFFAVKEKHMRKMPGRIAGMTKDIEGKRGFVLTMQAREQHIRREKATSNICTNEGLMALAACVYLSLVGREGIKEIARQNVLKSHYLKDKVLRLSGFELMFNAPFFNEFVVRCGKETDKITGDLLKHGVVGGLPLGRFNPEMKNCMLICVTETKTKEDLDRFAELLGKH